MLRRLAPALLALWPALAGAQDWATAENCTIAPGPVDAAVFEPPGLAALEAAAAQIPNGTGRFWQVTAPGGGVSHLWGTWHSADPLVLDLPARMEETLRTSRLVAVETDFVARSRAAYREAQYYDGRFREASDPFDFAGLDDMQIAGLPPEITGWILDRAIELGWTEDVTLVLSPAGIAEMLLSDPCEDFTDGILPAQDGYIQLIAHIEGLPVVGLEDRHRFLDDLNADEATADAIIAVYAAYLKPPASNAERSALFRLYLEGRLGLLAAWEAAWLEQVLGERARDDLRRTDEYLLRVRNERFLEKIAPELAEGGVFLAVGAAHLPGETGLVAMLRAAGYEVSRIALPGEAE